MKAVAYILILLFPVALSAQKVKWEDTTVNFGTVRDWNSPPATFTFQNTGKEKLMFLPQRHDREVLVRYPNHAIRPGETGTIQILYYTGETGSFSRTVEVYSSASNKAEKLTVKGNIKSIYADALTSCPSFQTTTPTKSGDPNVIQVVDAKMDRPIAGAQVEIYDRGVRKTINGTNLEGVAVNWIEPGKYIAVAYKEGYEKGEEEVAFSKRNRSHVLYLNRKVNQLEILDEEEIIASVDNRWEEPGEISEDRFQTSEPINENIDLGVTTNDGWDEEVVVETSEPVKTEVEDEFDLGITTNEVLAEEVIEPPVEEVFDLGITTNDSWDEPATVLEENEKPVEEVAEKEIDLGVSINDQLDEKVVELQPTQDEVERTVEAALANAEKDEPVAEVERQPEPEFSTNRYKPNNVLLLLDVSGSMKDDDKMVKLKSSIRRLVMMLREVDVLTMIAYNSTSWEVLAPTPVTDNQSIITLIDSLQPGGYTNGVKGMESAYSSLESQLISGGNNQLIIATDGKFNSSKFSEKDAISLVKSNSDKGIVLSIIGFGEDGEAGRLMKKLANLGEGSFLQVKNNEDPTELLAEEIKNRSRK